MNLKLERLIGIFGESVPEAAMQKAINDNPSANVTILANILCDMGNGLAKHWKKWTVVLVVVYIAFMLYADVHSLYTEV